MNLNELAALFSGLSEANRPIRLRLSGQHRIHDDALLVKQVTGQETLCGGIEYRLLCLSTDAGLPLKDFIALPVELQFVTAQGQLRSVCGIVAQASTGESDGGLATYQLVVRDALALMEQRTNTRVFRNSSEIGLSVAMLGEWRAINPILAKAFDIDISGLSAFYPPREFTMQYNESDAAFLRRMWKRQGISWFIRPGKASATGSDETPAHTLVLFDSPDCLAQNAAGTVRFHRDTATQSTDSVFSWGAVRNLRAGSVMRQSWDYRKGGMMSVEVPTTMQQGQAGDQFAFSLNDYLTDTPHVGENLSDYQRLGKLRMQRHEYEAKCFHGESGVRDLCVGEWIRLDGHPDIDEHAESEREFVLTELSLHAEDNLPKMLDDKVRRLFAANGWQAAITSAALTAASEQRDVKYTNRFSCVRRGIPIVPAYDPRIDLPRVDILSAIVVGPPGEEVHCDALGRVKLRFPGTRERDHADGPGASNSDADSAWVRVASHWASDQWGSISLPRVGDEVLVDFIGGDPDKPVVVGRVYGTARPPAFNQSGALPGNRFLAGMKSKEINGIRANQLRLDDTTGQINAQLASEHGHSELNLGWLTRPRRDGKGKARGEGAELRSDKAVAVRGKGGVFISADGQQGADGRLLQRDSLLGLAEVLKSVQQQLSQLSETHKADATATAKMDKMVESLKQWEAGSNTEPEGRGGKAPVVAISAPAGVAIGSQDSILLGAQAQIDIISVSNSQITSGKKILLRAAESISIFAHKLGMKLVAASGKMELQTHKGDIEITSAKRIVLSAADEIILQAPKVRIVTTGAQVDIGGDAIVQQCTHIHTIKSAKFAHVTGGGGSVPGLKLPTSDIKTDERIFLFDPQSGLPVIGRGYRATLPDGQVIEGKTDAQGRTSLMQSTAMGDFAIIIDPHDNS
jgi:type VI secretion system secreted protein VgrG